MAPALIHIVHNACLPVCLPRLPRCHRHTSTAAACARRVFSTWLRWASESIRRISARSPPAPKYFPPRELVPLGLCFDLPCLPYQHAAHHRLTTHTHTFNRRPAYDNQPEQPPSMNTGLLGSTHWNFGATFDTHTHTCITITESMALGGANYHYGTASCLYITHHVRRPSTGVTFDMSRPAVWLATSGKQRDTHREDNIWIFSSLFIAGSWQSPSQDLGHQIMNERGLPFGSRIIT
ncbi:uncharacterized protein B0I36DRAFT_335934 [Microdochium trichocladiopsis]|uniref:Uncharacterized protein n=1 Tax=Microdochium trichocladiopsis TaxID=1682393 RepID=A0A9P8XXS9_9PEZI|nr:uncharacterized protein B0I36DRAFT_335934 [Microdochium trichocladiopsis]KAH7018418.1 hypothetical protein B0I36DRAFT_335934 [Microdochium trichocladiopsis]